MARVTSARVIPAQAGIRILNVCTLVQSRTTECWHVLDPHLRGDVGGVRKHYTRRGACAALSAAVAMARPGRRGVAW